MKKITSLFTFFTLFFICQTLKSQCVLVPLTLEERVNASTLIVEGIVSSQKSYWTDDNGMIMTSSTIQISKIYKGASLISSSSVDVVTAGGTIGLKAVKVEPELELTEGEIGIFMLVNKHGDWVAESGPQGIIRIDKHTAEASDVFNAYPANSIGNTVKDLVKSEPVNINEWLTKVRVSSKRAAPTITSISPATITAGTSTVLTIKGTNFETAIDTNSVQFRNADDGGASFIKALKRDYVSWSDTMVRLIVRAKAGTGKIRMVIGGNGVVTSNDTLKVSYAHLNVVSGDTIGYETQQIGMNSNNGITWKMNKAFFDSAGARGAFTRSLERWRCGTFINWDTLGRVNHSSIKSDGVNMCAWDTSSAMPSGVLAQCFSFWGGCFSPGLKWYVNELDIRFRIKPTTGTNWNYTSGNATSTQFHFESVAVHELGHGHQLGHVINTPVVMHYSIGNGQTKPSLSTNDISGGTYVITKSATAVCGKNAHTKLNSGNCAMVAPNANFMMNKLAICKNETITFTDSSQGNISAYAWNFGANATPATANTKGPHTVTYSAGGIKTITLTITTIQGNLQKIKTADVKNDARMVSKFTYVAEEKGTVTFTNTSNNPVASQWYFGDGDSSTVTSPVHTYPSGGTFQVKLVSTNTCETRDTTIPVKFAWLNFYTDKISPCINEAVTYFDSSDNNAASWQWNFPGGTPSTANGKGPHNVTYPSAGSKSATLNITVSGAPAQTYTKNSILTVSNDTLSKAAFIFGYYGKNIVGFQNTSQGSNMTYKWYFGDGDSSMEQHPVHQYANASNQTVRLVVSGNCSTDDTVIQLRNFTALQPVSATFAFRVSPNPADRSFTIHSAGAAPLKVDIIDATGRLVMNKEVNSGENVLTDMLPDGLYTLKIHCGSLLETSRLMIRH